MTVAIPAGGLTIGIGDDGNFTGNLTLHIRFDVCPTWVELSLRHLEEAKANRTDRESAWVRTNEDLKASTLEREFEASMQAIMSAAIAIDAFTPSCKHMLCSQFFFLSMFAGGILWGVLISLAEKMGLSGAMASGVAGAISILLIALFVFGRWARQKRHSPQSAPQTNWQYRTGYALVAFGNTIFLLLIAFLFLVSPKYDYVVGGMAVFLGGGISLILWLIGWHIARYFRIY